MRGGDAGVTGEGDLDMGLGRMRGSQEDTSRLAVGGRGAGDNGDVGHETTTCPA